MNRYSQSKTSKEPKSSAESREMSKYGKETFKEEMDLDSGTILSSADLSSASSIYDSSSISSSGRVKFTETTKEICSTMSLDSGIQMDSGVIVSEDLSEKQIYEELLEETTEVSLSQSDRENVQYNTRREDSREPENQQYLIQDADGDTPLHLSIVQGNTALALALISHFQIYLDLLNSLYQTPLHVAVLTGQAGIARRLVIAGAKVDFQDHSGNTPLHLACRSGDYECVRALTLSAIPQEIQQAKLNYIPLIKEFNHLYKFKPESTKIKNFDGLTCLHLAAMAGQFRIVEYLSIQCGADINMKDGKSGQTVLHMCVQLQQIPALQVLMTRCNASLNICNYAIRTPLQLARVILRYKPSDTIAQGVVTTLQEFSQEDMSEDEDFTEDEDEDENN